MWHYTEGIQNWDPIWARHGIRILPGPSSLWLDARGRRFPAPNFPGFDTLGTLAAIRETGFDYSWFVLTQKIIEKEFALSGSEQNPDLTGKDIKLTLSRVRPGAPAPVEAFKQHGADPGDRGLTVGPRCPRMPVACLIGSIRQATFTYFSRRPSATAVPRSSRRRGVSAGCLRSSRRYTAAR
jgi:hypothetical protein